MLQRQDLISEVRRLRAENEQKDRELIESHKLPRVSPENLVEGEWYVFNYHQKFIPMFGKAEIHQGKFRLVDSFHSSKWAWANSETEIYGPVGFEKEQ